MFCPICGKEMKETPQGYWSTDLCWGEESDWVTEYYTYYCKDCKVHFNKGNNNKWQLPKTFKITATDKQRQYAFHLFGQEIFDFNLARKKIGEEVNRLKQEEINYKHLRALNNIFNHYGFSNCSGSTKEELIFSKEYIEDKLDVDVFIKKDLILKVNTYITHESIELDDIDLNPVKEDLKHIQDAILKIEN